MATLFAVVIFDGIYSFFASSWRASRSPSTPRIDLPLDLTPAGNLTGTPPSVSAPGSATPHLVLCAIHDPHRSVALHAAGVARGSNNFTFSPAKVEIVVGTVVMRVNRDDIPHTVVQKRWLLDRMAR